MPRSSKAATENFASLLKIQKTINDKSQWVDFGGNKPGIVPAGTDGSKNDITAYENVVVAVDTAGKVSQLQIGAMVKVENGWRLIDAPTAEGQQVTATVFITPSRSGNPSEHAAGNAPSSKSQEAIDALQKIDTAITRAGSQTELNKLNDERFNLMLQLAKDSNEAEKASFYKQAADAVSSAVQARTYPDGLKRLEEFLDKLEKENADKNVVAFVKYRQLQAEYAAAMQVESPNFSDIQKAWLGKLEKFTQDFPTSPDTVEAHVATWQRGRTRWSRSKSQGLVQGSCEEFRRHANCQESSRCDRAIGIGW